MSNDIAIKVENPCPEHGRRISKRYRIGLKEKMHSSLRSRAGYPLAGALTDTLTTMSYAQVSRYKVGDLTSYADQASYMNSLIRQINTLLSYLLMLAAYVVVLLWLSWPMTLAALVALVLLSSSLQRIRRQVGRIAREWIAASVALSERTIEFLQGLRLVRTFAREDYAIESVDAVLLDSVAARRRGLIWQATITPLMESLTVIGMAAFLMTGYLLPSTNSQPLTTFNVR